MNLGAPELLILLGFFALPIVIAVVVITTTSRSTKVRVPPPGPPPPFDAAPVAPQAPPPGFYADPDGTAGQRWWDGTGWTDVRR